MQRGAVGRKQVIVKIKAKIGKKFLPFMSLRDFKCRLQHDAHTEAISIKSQNKRGK